MYEVEHISIYIHRVPEDVYSFASNPENLMRCHAAQKAPDKFLQTDKDMLLCLLQTSKKPRPHVVTA